MSPLFTSTSGSGHIQQVVETAGLRPLAAGRTWQEWRAAGHYLDPATFPSPRDWLIAFQAKTVRSVAARAFSMNLLLNRESLADRSDAVIEVDQAVGLLGIAPGRMRAAFGSQRGEARHVVAQLADERLALPDLLGP